MSDPTAIRRAALEEAAKVADGYALKAAESSEHATQEAIAEARAATAADQPDVRARWRQGQHYFNGKRHCAVEVAAAIRALADQPAPVPDGWRPISTYPRDADGWGPNALLFVPTGLVAPASDYRILTGRLEAEMWIDWGTDGSCGDIEGEPSRWMPLPPPPSLETPDGK